MKLQPFQINIPQSVLDDLQQRLARTRWPDEVDGVGWGYGTNMAFMRRLVDYWQTKYDWRAQEAKLNQFSHFRTEVDGVGIHLIHERGKGPNPIPIILTHGWPDSFYRFHKIIPMLTDPARFGGDANLSFDVVVPSIPGFGFSDRKSMTEGAVADLWAKLMIDGLGYDRFVAAGGDIGSGVTMTLAAKNPEHVAAIHLTDVGYPTGQEDFSTMSEAEQQFAGFIQQWWFTEGAYNMLQATKPQTLGFALNDSPVGLAAWIVEKFYTWSGNKEDAFTQDELLTNIMIYWVTETSTSSARMYLENARAEYGAEPPQRHRVETPAAIAHFPAEAPLPREWAERRVNVKRFTEMPSGGHFAALELPELFVQDLHDFFGAQWQR
jgi:pimeloyl-ACP methyl ester carboxylesterase